MIAGGLEDRKSRCGSLDSGSVDDDVDCRRRRGHTGVICGDRSQRVRPCGDIGPTRAEGARSVRPNQLRARVKVYPNDRTIRVPGNRTERYRRWSGER